MKARLFILHIIYVLIEIFWILLPNLGWISVLFCCCCKNYSMWNIFSIPATTISWFSMSIRWSHIAILNRLFIFYNLCFFSVNTVYNQNFRAMYSLTILCKTTQPSVNFSLQYWVPIALIFELIETAKQLSWYWETKLCAVQNIKGFRKEYDSIP